MTDLLAPALRADRLLAFLRDRGIDVSLLSIEDRSADGFWIVAPDGLLAAGLLDTYTDDYVPDAVSGHRQHLVDFLRADPATPVTNAQRDHVLRDVIRALAYLNRELAE